MEVGEILDRLTGGQRVYGEPYERDGVTVIPAYSVRAGGGFGRGPEKGAGTDTGTSPGTDSGGTSGGIVAAITDRLPDGDSAGGGGGVIARPVGAYIVKDGEARWEPAVDVNRAILGGQILAALALIVWAVTRRRS
ncbi:hypothetical protein [Microbispora sp. ATCC PTA-5024]|uniref:hypothetical protein n=1 Tax=Microbispora sp. ATCC PTA-5024 TaxID=316330 RepID=UPI0003DC2DC8|nr:hypothetical protein [Microbispora sp. ATCC PTA-5024]ETK32627.1 hypothetical protein MPTA5024_28710 [Microbispora sp. ATCC PTA-5024]